VNEKTLQESSVQRFRMGAPVAGLCRCAPDYLPGLILLRPAN